MGGFIFIIPITIVTFLIGGFYIDTVLPVLALLLFGSIGFIDDYIKVVKKRNLGLRAYQKIILQFTFAMVVSLLEVKYSSLGTSVYIPFSNKLWDMGCLYIPFLVILLIGVSNSVNLTDGLDGLFDNEVKLKAAVEKFNGNFEKFSVSKREWETKNEEWISTNPSN